MNNYLLVNNITSHVNLLVYLEKQYTTYSTQCLLQIFIGRYYNKADCGNK